MTFGEFDIVINHFEALIFDHIIIFKPFNIDFVCLNFHQRIKSSKSVFFLNNFCLNSVTSLYGRYKQYCQRFSSSVTIISSFVNCVTRIDYNIKVLSFMTPNILQFIFNKNNDHLFQQYDLCGVAPLNNFAY